MAIEHGAAAQPAKEASTQIRFSDTISLEPVSYRESTCTMQRSFAGDLGLT